MRPRAGFGTVEDQGETDVDQDHFAVGIAVSVSLLVGLLEAGDQVGGVGLGIARDRQLECLAGVPHAVDDLGPGAFETPMLMGRKVLHIRTFRPINMGVAAC